MTNRWYSLKEICEYLGVYSCSDLPIITKTFVTYQISELKNIGVTDFMFIGRKSKNNSINAKCVDNIQEFEDVLTKTDDKNIIVTASNIFFQFKCDKIDLSILDLTAVSFTADSGDVCAVHLNKNKLLET